MGDCKVKQTLSHSAAPFQSKLLTVSTLYKNAVFEDPNLYYSDSSELSFLR